VGRDVSTLVAMARSLQIAVVAEGVETEEQLLYLRNRVAPRRKDFSSATPCALLRSSNN
jgi:predicted signal transduction protein with EAL and GGDEF domain